uniref:ArsR family transcriptional regulator n=1 Tax=Candidatus Methanomethylicus mesodigestus TaxID=1867258 RepID=A0A7C3N4U4_9CREN
MEDEAREIMDALADKTRYSIVKALLDKRMTGDEMAKIAGKARSTVESHLAMLLRLNLVTRELKDRTYYYEATPVAKGWVEKVDSSIAHDGKAMTKRNEPDLTWLYAPVPIGIFYVLSNAYLMPVHILIPSVLLGLIGAFFRNSFKKLFRSIIVASATIALATFPIIGGLPLIQLSTIFVVTFMFVFIGAFIGWAALKLAFKYLPK